MLEAVLYPFLAGLAIPLGGLIARFERIGPAWLESEFRHGVIAFGAGALLSAVALVLVPEGMKHLSAFPLAACFLLGGISFFALDLFLAARSGQFGQLLAMLSDFIPEALALGATFTNSPETGVLLAGIIALQNCPEGFNSYRELLDSGKRSPKVILGLFIAMAFLGPAAGSLGYLYLSTHPAIIAGIMAFSAGGILYIIFQDLAPQIRLENSWIPPLGAILGFMIGLIGKSLTG